MPRSTGHWCGTRARRPPSRRPHGGTKVAWGGLSDAPKPTRNHQRFDLVADDVDAAVERLLELGATRLSGSELADPDGNEFSVRLAR